jgi:hypothetical protein
MIWLWGGLMGLDQVDLEGKMAVAGFSGVGVWCGLALAAGIDVDGLKQ